MEDQYDEREFYSNDKSELEEKEDDSDCPNIKLSREERHCIKKLWLKTLILKVLGKRVGFKFLEKRVIQL